MDLFDTSAIALPSTEPSGDQHPVSGFACIQYARKHRHQLWIGMAKERRRICSMINIRKRRLATAERARSKLPEMVMRQTGI